MATSAFKSTTKRTPIASDDSAAFSRTSSAHRRSRSLSRFSHRISSPAEEEFPDDGPVPRGRFVNTVRGSGFPEISLDDLAVEFFGSGESSGDRGRSATRSSGTGPARSGGGDVAQRRGRSVSRHGPRLSYGGGGGGGGDGKLSVSNGGGRLGSNNGDNSRRRRSVSVVRYQISDSESDLDHSQKRNNVNPKSFAKGTNESNPSQKPKASNHRQGLRRSFSQKDFRPCDDYSSQSSILTDDEGKGFRSSKFGKEKTIRAVYAQNKAQHPTEDDVNGNLYEAMRTELRHAVAEIRTEFEQFARGENKPAVSSIMRNYSTKLEESEKRKHDLLSEIVLEEQRRRELSMLVKEFLPNPKDNIVNNIPSRVGPRRGSDRNRMTKRLSEEAEKYIEDFISSIEDTDISSLDGERSDTSSSIGGIMKARSAQSPATPLLPLPIDMDGVSLPWLKWETCNDVTPITDPSTTPETMLYAPAEVKEVSNGVHDRVNLSGSSHGSCSPGILDSLPRHIVTVIDDSPKALKFDIEEYFNSRHDEDLLFERFRQRNQIDSGTMLICNSMKY